MNFEKIMLLTDCINYIESLFTDICISEIDSQITKNIPIDIYLKKIKGENIFGNTIHSVKYIPTEQFINSKFKTIKVKDNTLFLNYEEIMKFDISCKDKLYQILETEFTTISNIIDLQIES